MTEFTTKALIKCTSCGKEFTTSSDGSKIRFEGVRNHGRDQHVSEEWDFEILDRDYSN